MDISHPTPVELPGFPGAPCPSLLKSNEMPTHEQEAAILRSIVAAERTIARLGCIDPSTLLGDISQDDIHRLEQIWIRFLEDHRALVRTIPRRMIPVEIWQIVFKHYVWMEFDFEEQESRNTQFMCTVLRTSFPQNDRGLFRQPSKRSKKVHLQAPFVLTHVCHLWRSITLAVPDLWSYIRCHIPAPHEQIQAWLARSKDRPLHIRAATTRDMAGHLYGSSAHPRSNFANEHSLNSLMWHCKRWVEVDLNLWTGMAELEGVLRRINGAAPMLRSLHTRGSILYGYNISPDGQTRLSVNNLPSLTSLTWASDTLQDIIAFPRYTALTSFSGAFYQVQSLAEIFSIIIESMPELTELDLGIQSRFENEPETDLQDVVHTRLSSLKLEWYGRHTDEVDYSNTRTSRDYIDAFLEHVSFPSLTSFSLACGYGIGRPDVMSSFLRKHASINALVFSLPGTDIKLERAPARIMAAGLHLLGSIPIRHSRSQNGEFETFDVVLPPGNNWFCTRRIS